MKIPCFVCHTIVSRTPSQLKKSKSGLTFCGHKCCVTHNKPSQHIKPKLRTCKRCATEYRPDKGNPSRVLCYSCRKDEIERQTGGKDCTIQEFYDKRKTPNLTKSWVYGRIRDRGRAWNSYREQSCQYCGYSTIVEFCHIKPVSKFNWSCTLGEVNAPSNILILCPNHHAEFDRGLLTVEEIGRVGVEPTSCGNLPPTATL